MGNPALEYACEKRLAYRKRRFAWAREIGRPVSRHKGQKPDPETADPDDEEG